MKKFILGLGVILITIGFNLHTNKRCMHEKSVSGSHEVKKYTCISCALQTGELQTIGGLIAATHYFQARQDYAVPIPGFIIIAAKRHIKSLDECTKEERADFIEFVYAVRKHMREQLAIETVYLIQEEDAQHFHLWLFPRYAWMKEFGSKIASVKPIMHWAKENLNTQENVNKVREAAEKLKKSMNPFFSTDIKNYINWANEVSEDTINDSWGTWKTHFSDCNPTITREEFLLAIKNGEYKTMSIDEFLALEVKNQRLDRYLKAKTAQEAYPIEDRPRHEDDIKSVDYFLKTTLPVSPILVARVHGVDSIFYIKLDGVHRLIATAIKKSPIKVLFVDL